MDDDIVSKFWCLTVDSNNYFNPGKMFPLYVKVSDDVRAIQNQIKATFPRFDHLSANDLVLWKLVDPLPADDVSRIVEALENLELGRFSEAKGRATILSPAESLQASFNGRLYLLLQLPSGVTISPSNSARDDLSGVAGGLGLERTPSHPFPLANHITRREKLVALLFDMVWKHQLVQIRGSPATGKSIVLHLLHHQIIKSSPSSRVYRFDGWDTTRPSTYQEVIKFKIPTFPNSNVSTFLLFDDAQDTYDDRGLWDGFFKALEAFSNYRVVLFCSYGSASAQPSASKRGTPLRIKDSQRLSLLPTMDTPLGLLLTRPEFDDMLSRAPADQKHLDVPPNEPPRPIWLAPDLRDSIYWWTAGHAGAVNFLLQSIRVKSHDARIGQEYTLEKFLLQHPIHEMARDYTRSNSGRGFPTLGMLKRVPSGMKMFRILLRNGYMLDNDAGTDVELAVKHAHERGWIYSINNSEDTQPAFILPSPMHVSFLSWILETAPDTPIFGSLLDLIIRTLSLIQPSQLFLPLRRVGQQLPTQPPEAQYQDEFYRALHDLMHGSIRISSEFASAKRANVAGRIDFYIPSARWGIEMTRDGCRLQEHSNRFSDRGAYGEWLRTGEMVDYVLLDCRTTMPQRSHPRIPNLYHAVFESNFAAVSLYNSDLDPIHQTELSERQL